MTGRRASRLSLLLLVPVLSSCALTTTTPAEEGVSASSSTPEATTARPNTSAAPGSVSSRDRTFGVVPPTGWTDISHTSRAAQLYLRDPRPQGRVFPSFTVVTTTQRKPPPLEDLVDQGMIAQRQKGATVSRLADRTIGGLPAAGYSMTLEQDDVEVAQSQYYVVNDTTILVVTTTSSPAGRSGVSRAQEALFRSWSWGPGASRMAPPTPTSTSSTPSSSASSSTGSPSSGAPTSTGSATSRTAPSPSPSPTSGR